LHPEVQVADKSAAATVIGRLVHLAKYRGVRELENNDPTSPLKGKLVVRLLGAQDEYDPADRPAPKPFAAGRPPTLRVGQWMFLSIENTSDRGLNVAVLDPAPRWALAYADPPAPHPNLHPPHP